MELKLIQQLSIHSSAIYVRRKTWTTQLQASINYIPMLFLAGPIQIVELDKLLMTDGVEFFVSFK